MPFIVRHRIWSAMLVLAWAIFGYLHDAYQTFDLAAQHWPFGPETGTLADIPDDVKNSTADGSRSTGLRFRWTLRG